MRVNRFQAHSYLIGLGCRLALAWPLSRKLKFSVTGLLLLYELYKGYVAVNEGFPQHSIYLVQEECRSGNLTVKSLVWRSVTLMSASITSWKNSSFFFSESNTSNHALARPLFFPAAMMLSHGFFRLFELYRIRKPQVSLMKSNQDRAGCFRLRHRMFFFGLLAGVAYYFREHSFLSAFSISLSTVVEISFAQAAILSKLERRNAFQFWENRQRKKLGDSAKDLFDSSSTEHLRTL